MALPFASVRQEQHSERDRGAVSNWAGRTSQLLLTGQDRQTCRIHKQISGSKLNHVSELSLFAADGALRVIRPVPMETVACEGPPDPTRTVGLSHLVERRPLRLALACFGGCAMPKSKRSAAVALRVLHMTVAVAPVCPT